MNNARRKAIRAIIKKIEAGNRDWESIESDLTDIMDEETDAMENIPESLQDTERYYTCEESVGYLDDAIGCIDPDDEDAAENVVKALSMIDGV